jgi:hypothetical protein
VSNRAGGWASPESQISRRWWCLSKGAVLEWVGGDLVQCAVMGSPEAEVGVGEREVCCGLWEREEGEGDRACVGEWGLFFIKSKNQKLNYNLLNCSHVIREQNSGKLSVCVAALLKFLVAGVFKQK